jgi:hypothetical protein
MYLRICGSFRSAKITWVHELQIRKLQKSMWSANWKSANCKKYMGRKYGIRKLQNLRKVRYSAWAVRQPYAGVNFIPPFRLYEFGYKYASHTPCIL